MRKVREFTRNLLTRVWYRRRWLVGHRREGYLVATYRVPVWTIIIESVWLQLCGVTGDRLCGAGLGEWAWKLPLGRAHWDHTLSDEPWLMNSLAVRLNNIEQWICSWESRLRRDEVELPLTLDQARLIDPDFVTSHETLLAEEIRPAIDELERQFEEPDGIGG